MYTERLYINNQFIPLSNGLNPSINKAVQDITKSEKPDSDYSKSIVAPRSQELDKVLSHVFETNLSNGTYNPNIKASMRYTVDDIDIIVGYMKLSGINILDEEEITYELILYGIKASFLADIKDLFMTDLYDSVGSYEGLDIYDHSFTKEIQQLSWATQIIKNGVLEPFQFGKGYVYPLIDYGLSQDSTNFVFNQIACCLYEHELMKRAIKKTGRTYTSSFLDGNFFKHIVLPSNPDVYQLSSSQISSREFSANTPILFSTGNNISVNLTNGFNTPDSIIFTNDSVLPSFDPGGNYNPTTGEFTVVNTGIYDVNAIIDINATFTPLSGIPVKTTCEVNGFIMFFLNGIQVDSKPFYITSDDGFSIGPRSTSSTPIYPDSDYTSQPRFPTVFPFGDNAIPRNVNPPDRYLISGVGVPLQVGDVITLKWKAKISTNENDRFKDALGFYSGGNVKVSFPVGAFYTKVSNTLMSEGNTLTMDKVLPQNMRVSDYFMANVKRFNLIIDIDPNDENNLIIETRDVYLTNKVRNIHELIDNSQEITQLPMNSLDAKRYYYTYKPDQDYWNKKYTENWQGRIYGDRIINVLNDFVSSEKRTELLFSPTTMVGAPNNNRVLPTILGYDQFNNPITTKHNTRSLYYGGMKPCLNTWSHINYVSVFAIPNPDVFSSYPYAGMWDDPYNPTVSISFGLEQEVFYDDNINNIVATDNNLFNIYHAKTIREITDPKSKIVKCRVHINPGNYKDFSFRDLYFFNESYYRLQKIEAYNPTSSDTTMCTFLLINEASGFIPSNVILTGSNTPFQPAQNGGNIDANEQASIKGTSTHKQPNQNNTGSGSIQTKGQNNYVNTTAKNVEIYGNNNKVWSDTSNIKIQGSGNTIDGGVKNVTLINTNNQFISDSDVTYIDGKKQNSWVERSTPFIVDDTIYGYYLNGSNQVVQARLNNSKSEFYFKCI
ncbi:MAG: hypothetical protein ACRCYO_13590, partial [Bacteroidia bacterium]